jgi:hypothetical protein
VFLLLTKLFEKIRYYSNPYRVYYRIYYYLFGRRAIANPKKVVPPSTVIPCRSEIDPELRKHHNFLFAKVKPKKWLYWRRKFAFRIKGTEQWYLCPKLTPWDTDKEGTTQFGLNFTLLEKWKSAELEFITWL